MRPAWTAPEALDSEAYEAADVRCTVASSDAVRGYAVLERLDLTPGLDLAAWWARAAPPGRVRAWLEDFPAGATAGRPVAVLRLWGELRVRESGSVEADHGDLIAVILEDGTPADVIARLEATGAARKVSIVGPSARAGMKYEAVGRLSWDLRFIAARRALWHLAEAEARRRQDARESDDHPAEVFVGLVAAAERLVDEQDVDAERRLQVRAFVYEAMATSTSMETWYHGQPSSPAPVDFIAEVLDQARALASDKLGMPTVRVV